MPRSRPEPDACHACDSTVDLESCSWRQCAVRVCVDHRKVCEDCGEVLLDFDRNAIEFAEQG